MGLTGWPAVTDDSGTKTDGTIFNKALTDAIKASIEASVFSTTNPTVTGEDIIDEVVTARGSEASLDARLDVALNEDGTLKSVAGQASESQVASFAAVNWIQNDDFLIWPAGDAAAPAGWTLAGAGASVARTGAGLGDTNAKVGAYAVKVTRAAVDVTLSQSLLNSTSFGVSGGSLKSRTFTFGAWVKTSIGSMARVRLYDGVAGDQTAYHTGDGTWQFLSTTYTLSGSATELTLQLEVKSSSGDAYFSGVTAMPGTVDLTDWVPCPKIYGAIVFDLAGTQTVADDKKRFTLARPTLVKHAELSIVTAPLTTAVIIDVEVWDGAAWQTMFSTLPQIAASANQGGQVVDGTYRYRCLAGASGATLTNATIRINVDQVGTGTVGSDLIASLRAMQYLRPQESLLAYNDGEA